MADRQGDKPDRRSSRPEFGQRYQHDRPARSLHRSKPDQTGVGAPEHHGPEPRRGHHGNRGGHQSGPGHQAECCAGKGPASARIVLIAVHAKEGGAHAHRAQDQQNLLRGGHRLETPELGRRKQVAVQRQEDQVGERTRRGPEAVDQCLDRERPHSTSVVPVGGTELVQFQLTLRSVTCPATQEKRAARRQPRGIRICLTA